MPSLRVVHEHDLSEDDHSLLFDRRAPLDGLRDTVQAIVDGVRSGGDAALLRYTEQFDGAMLDAVEVPDDEFDVAESRVDAPVRDALRSEIAAVRAFHRVQMPVEEVVETLPGVRTWREWRPIGRVGLYVPGGRGPYPSSVVMLGVPASIAGCREIVLCTPPADNGCIPPATLLAARMAGIHRVFKVGGAQAIAAMAYGTESIPKVDKVFGAGNAFVTAAKLLVFPDCMLDVPAGPSELLIIADEGAEPAWIAADLLSDVEHGPDSPAVLVTTSERLARCVAEEVDRRLESLPRRELARRALEDRGIAVVTDTLQDAVALADAYAPEHLEIMIENPREALRGIDNVGSAFLGPYAPNAAGDYATGTNHVLPTARYARTDGPVSVESFGRLIQCQELSEDGLAAVLPTVQALARAEGLEAHARAVEARFGERDS